MIILFGAGVYAKKYKALLEYLHMDFDFFTDNDSSKWGTVLYGKPVISPNELLDISDCQIIISSTHEVAIRKQLTDMGLNDSIVGLDDLYDLCEKQTIGAEASVKAADSEDTIIVDMYEGIGWGGTELWAANLAYGLCESGKKVILLGGTEQPALESVYEQLTVRVSEQDTIMHMVDLIEKNLPCVFINNFAGCAFMAAIIVKKKYPDLVKIISVIHNDNKSLFDAHMMLAQYIDTVFCVSNQIREHMLPLYSMPKEKYHFKEQPIPMENSWIRTANQSDILRIGYAARLVRQQKRADLLQNLVSELEKRNLHYIFQIAGEGECEEVLRSFVARNQLQNKVQLLGRMSKSQMKDFWKRQDVFVNVSEYEGTSLSMLEAMSYGCVPVVTDVSGAREFISSGRNGYVCDVRDVEGMAECIACLERDRDILRRYGEECRDIIRNRCNPDEYLRFWLEEVIGKVKARGD